MKFKLEFSLFDKKKSPQPEEVKGYGTFISDGLAYVTERKNDFIEYGYNTNSDVFAIVNLAARKFGQVPWYVYKVKRNKAQELKEYLRYSKANRNPSRAAEINGLRKKAVDEMIVENELSELLNNPNPYQSQNFFLEQLYGYKLLTGEGNIWKNRGKGRKPLELFLIPKNILEIIPKDSFRIAAWWMAIGSSRIRVPVEDIICWRFPSYKFDPIALSHLRGQSPLMSMLNDLEAGNEAAKNRVKMNKNQGARGVLTDMTGDGLKPAQLSPSQQSELKRIIDAKINTNDVAGSIAVLQGVWNYHSLGMDAGQLRLIEQYNMNTQKLCAGFNVPYEFFDPSTTFANKEQAGKQFLYNHIAPAIYSIRDELNKSLLKDFSLSDSQYIIEPDVMSLPEAMEDLGKQITMLKDAWWLTPNRRLEITGEDKSADPNMDKIFIPSGLRTLESAVDDIGSSLDEQEDTLRRSGLLE